MISILNLNTSQCISLLTKGFLLETFHIILHKMHWINNYKNTSTMVACLPRLLKLLFWFTPLHIVILFVFAIDTLKLLLKSLLNATIMTHNLLN